MPPNDLTTFLNPQADIAITYSDIIINLQEKKRTDTKNSIKFYRQDVLYTIPKITFYRFIKNIY